MNNWQDINEDEILSMAVTHTGKIAQFDRIMSKKLRETLNSLNKSFVEETQALKQSIDHFNITSSHLSSRLLWLNVFLVLLTIILVLFGLPTFIEAIIKYIHF